MAGYRHLSCEEREQIAVQRAAGRSMAAIARVLGRAKTTISRELERNACPSGRYAPLVADGAYLLRRQRQAVLERDEKLRTFVIARLNEGWSPEQVAGWLKGGHERKLRTLVPETIYAFVYRAKQKADRLWLMLTRRHKRRRPYTSRPSRDRIKDRISIHERPDGVENRAEVGHWEGDLVICKHARPVLVLHERKTRITLIARLSGKTAAETIATMLAVFDRVPQALRKSITFDLDTITDEDIQDISLTMNLTPRKCLSFKTPLHAMLEEKGKNLQIRFA